VSTVLLGTPSRHLELQAQEHLFIWREVVRERWPAGTVLLEVRS
jgi:hypothetical protein